MTDDRGTLRSIAWRDICPWLMLFRTFWLSLTVPLLVLATTAVLVQPLGWKLAGLIFVSGQELDVTTRLEKESDEELLQRKIFKESYDLLTQWQPARDKRDHGTASEILGMTSLRSLVNQVGVDYATVWDRASYPFVQLFKRQLKLHQFCFYLLGGLWNLALWSVVGGTITRVAVVYLGLEERLSVRDALMFTVTRFRHYFGAPLYPLLGILLLGLPIALLGLIMYFDVGVLIGGILWFLVLIAALASAILAIGLLFGWPLMWPAISAENGDAFEGLSRSFGYTFQRSFHYLFYALVATLFAAICILMVSGVAVTSVELARWSASWGTGNARMEAIELAAHSKDWGALPTGAALIEFWKLIVDCIVRGFTFTLFFTLASAIYLLLRQVDDETEFDEIYLDDDDHRYTLPEVTRDSAGVATMNTGSATAPASDRPLAEEE